MSVGINLLMNLVGKASNIFFDSNTSVEILDIHHKHKKDAPSGTALALGEVVVKERKFNLRNNIIYIICHIRLFVEYFKNNWKG